MTAQKAVLQLALTLIAKKIQIKTQKKRAGPATTLPKTTLTIAWIFVLMITLIMLPPRCFNQMVRTAGLAQGTTIA